MPTRDEELERIVRAAAAQAQVPEFERTWRRAQARAGKGGFRGGAWQWAIGPALAAVSIAIVVVAVRGVPTADAPAASAQGEGKLSVVAVADAGAGAARAEETAAAEVQTASAADGLYVAGTDFLLEMEIPAWN
jgi:hypothetical protein